MIRDAVTCDQDGCLGLMLEPLECAVGVDRCTGCEYCEEPLEGHMAWRGWIRDESGHVCPACNHGRGPVLERGECPACTGRTSDRPEGAVCLYCRTVVPVCPVCPDCGSGDLTAYSYDGGRTTTGYECRDCGHNWRTPDLG